jgi:hypothetical protein
VGSWHEKCDAFPDKPSWGDASQLVRVYCYEADFVLLTSENIMKREDEEYQRGFLRELQQEATRYPNQTKRDDQIWLQNIIDIRAHPAFPGVAASV